MEEIVPTEDVEPVKEESLLLTAPTSNIACAN